MKLLNELYKIENHDPAEKRFTLRLIPESVIYHAHFPDWPVTPGVCIIGMASELLSEIMAKPVKLLSVSNAKFLAVIDPRQTRGVDYHFKKIITDESTGSVKVSVEVRNEETVFSKLSLNYHYD